MAEFVIGALVAAPLNVFFESLASWAKDLFGGNDEEDILKLVEDLKTKKSSADLLLSLAEEKLVTDHTVRQWLDDLKDNIYRADDSLYMIETESLQRKKTNEALQCFFSSTSSNQISMLEETLRKLNSCLEDEGPHREHLNRINVERHYPPSLEQDEVYGRNADKEEIIRSLLQDDMTNDVCSFFVISLVGMGGIGKTTFAEFVYTDERIHSRFDRKVWITVGDDKLDCSKVMKSIVGKVTSQPCQTNDLHDLQEEVKRTLDRKKFLFVLDDVWDEDHSKWDLLSHSFRSGLPGSKIIVTTRSNKVAMIMTPGTTYKLNPLSNTDGFELFVKHAYVDFNDHLYLKDIAKEIVGKCKGIPLAIKSIGGLLRGNHNKETWSKILNDSIWELYKREKVRILPALWLSYLYLPSPLKQCFAYCSIFPKDHKFVKEDMILLWMAEGYLNSQNGKSAEEVGEEYFDNLISKSFFQETHYKHHLELELESELELELELIKDFISFFPPTYLMHDLVHDLAIYISGEFSVTKYDQRCSPKARHVRYGASCEEDVELKNFENLSKAKCFLRTLLLECKPSLEGKSGWLSKVEELHESFPRLRVLSILNYELTKFPASITNLKYLKFLNLDLRSVQEIPNTFCSLYNLETLLLRRCSRVTQLPTDIGNLEKLGRLLVPSSLKEMPLQFGKLRNLERLNRFAVGKRKDCGGIELLKNVPDLHGHLEIVGLENVSSLEEDSHAILKSMKFLSILSLEWARDDEPDDSCKDKDREILSALEPHPNVKELQINGYKGTGFPSWLGDRLTSLKILKLRNCRNCSILPSLGQLPSLEQLEISELASVVRIDSNFYDSSAVMRKPFRSLERLTISRMDKLEEWSFIEGGDFPCLKELSLHLCPQLILSLRSDHFPSLRKLKINRCKQLLPPSAQPMHSPFPSLENLMIRDCGGRELLLVEGGFPSSLKDISIGYCKDLECFHEGAFQRLTSLKKLSIEYCPKLRCLPKELPTSLSHLDVGYCDLLTTRIQRESGKDWPNIAHIPNISIKEKVSRKKPMSSLYRRRK